MMWINVKQKYLAFLRVLLKISMNADLGIGLSITLFTLVHFHRIGWFKADLLNQRWSSFSPRGISCL
jgi:hypothetical protein